MNKTQAQKRTELIQSAKDKTEDARVQNQADKAGVVIPDSCGCWNFVHLGRCIHTV